MKLKTLYIFLAILLVGISAVVFLNYRQSNIIENDSYSLPKINSEEVETIKIKTISNELELKKTSVGNEWEVNGKLADSSKINNLIESISSAEVKGPIGTSEKNYNQFSVDSDTGTDLIILGNSGEKLLHLIIGKNSANYGSTYFRPYESTNVYEANNTWSISIYKTVNEWRDKTVWSFSDGQIKKVIAKEGRKSYEAKEADGDWTISSNGISKKVDNLKTSIKSLTADDFIEGKKELKDTLILFDENEQELASFNLVKDDSNYYIKNSDSDDIFKISSYTFEKVWLPVLFNNKE